jgi:Zn finger protein HypA/HybF involved in hydrogenase expression
MKIGAADLHIVANVTVMKTSEMLLKFMSRAVAKAVGTTAEQIIKLQYIICKQCYSNKYDIQKYKTIKMENIYLQIFSGSIDSGLT